MPKEVKELLGNIWFASAIVALFSSGGVLCLTPAALLTFVAFVVYG
jgi:hypothetical protein